MHQIELGVVQTHVQIFVEKAIFIRGVFKGDDAEGFGFDHALAGEHSQLAINISVEFEETRGIGLVGKFYRLIDRLAQGAGLEIHLVGGQDRHDGDEGLTAFGKRVSHAEHVSLERGHHFLHD